MVQTTQISLLDGLKNVRSDIQAYLDGGGTLIANELTDWKGGRCAVGVLNEAANGHPTRWDVDGWRIRYDGFEFSNLVYTNNSATDDNRPKAVLDYLDREITNHEPVAA